MTRFCANCERNDHNSCMIAHDREEICRRCQLFLVSPKTEFACECRTYEKRFLRDLSKSNVFNLFCEECKSCISIRKNQEYHDKSYAERQEKDCFDQIFFMISYNYDYLIRKNYNKNFYLDLDIRENLCRQMIETFRDMFEIKRKS